MSLCLINKWSDYCKNKILQWILSDLTFESLKMVRVDQNVKNVNEDYVVSLRFLWQCGWGFRSSEVWHCVAGWMLSDILKENHSFICWSQAVQEEWSLTGWPLKKKALHSFETWVYTHPATHNTWIFNKYIVFDGFNILNI